MTQSPPEQTVSDIRNSIPRISIDEEDDAMITSSEDQNLSASQNSNELPLIVWVRGDEPYATEFFLEADDVIALLGIKRSRLTQISGRELRVGRRRVGRYIRPFYREIDVMAYKEWTRPTAAHVKSKEFVDHALQQLQGLGSYLQENLMTDFAELKLKAEGLWDSGQNLQKLEKVRFETLLSQNRVNQICLQQLQQQQEQLQDTGKSLDGKVTQLHEQQSVQQQLNHDIWLKVMTMQQQLQSLQTLCQALALDLQQRSQDVQDSLLEIKCQNEISPPYSSLQHVNKVMCGIAFRRIRYEIGTRQRSRPFLGIHCEA